MLILPISRTWIDSPAARSVYLICSALDLALLGTLAGVRAAQIAVASGTLPSDTAAVLRLVLVPEVIGTGLLWVGMLYFWFNVDRSSWLKRALWATFVLFFFSLALPLYYFFVYRKWTRSGGNTAASSPTPLPHG